MTLNQIVRQIAEARRAMEQIAKLYPGCFDAQGRPIVATLRLPPHPTTTRSEP